MNHQQQFSNRYNREYHPCKVYACGMNTSYALGIPEGNRKTISSYEPLLFPFNNESIISIALGMEHSIFLTEKHNIFVCGSNKFGQLGFKKDKSMKRVPTLLRLSSPQRLDGSNKQQQIKEKEQIDNVVEGSSLDVESIKKEETIEKPEYIVQIYSGEYHSAFLSNKGQVYSCGQNSFGQLGLCTVSNQFGPRLVSIFCEHPYGIDFKPNSQLTSHHVKDIYCGSFHTFFRMDNNEIYGCGCNTNGGLGFGDTLNRSVPCRIPFFSTLKDTVDDIQCGASHSVFKTESGKIYVCGNNRDGRLGIQQKADSGNSEFRVTIPILLSDDVGKALFVKCGSFHNVVGLENGDIYVFGQNDLGQLGLNNNVNRMLPEILHPPSGGKIRHVACASRATIVISSNSNFKEDSNSFGTDSLMHATGWNLYGTLGLQHLDDCFEFNNVPLFMPHYQQRNGLGHRQLSSTFQIFSSSCSNGIFIVEKRNRRLEWFTKKIKERSNSLRFNVAFEDVDFICVDNC
ncbi:hypothetical protein ABK040_006482 [Willaertia magna]